MKAHHWALLPVAALQAVWVLARAKRLPEADGPRKGRQGQGPPLRVLILGDSSAAGVGVAAQKQALAGQLSTRLAVHHDVIWRLEARTGHTARRAAAQLARVSDEFDMTVLALGVNDAKNGVRTGIWRRAYEALLDDLQHRLNVTQIYASGVPPLGKFPLLPSPLNAVLGARAEALDEALADLCRARSGVTYLPFDLPFDPALMAADGFHPSGGIYAEWAQRVAAAAITNMKIQG